MADSSLGESKGSPTGGETEVIEQPSQRKLAVDREKHEHVGPEAMGAAPSVESPVSAALLEARR